MSDYIEAVARIAALRAQGKVRMVGLLPDEAELFGAALGAIGTHLIRADDRHRRRFGRPALWASIKERHIRRGVRFAFWERVR